MTNPCDDNNRFYSSVDRAWASDKEAKANLKAWATEARSKTAEAVRVEVAKAAEDTAKVEAVRVEAVRVEAWRKAAEVDRIKAAEVWAKAEIWAKAKAAKAEADFEAEAEANRIKAEVNRIKAESEAWAKASWFTKLWMWLDKNG